MIQTMLRIISSRPGKLRSRFTAILLSLTIPYSAASHTPPFPEANVIRSRTTAGYPYLNGGISFDEQRVMERADAPYNLKLVFASRLGTPVTPAFVVIGANNGQHIEKVLLRAPWFYIQLPPGGYTILTRFTREVVLLRDVNITQQRVRKYFLRGN